MAGDVAVQDPVSDPQHPGEKGTEIHNITCAAFSSLLSLPSFYAIHQSPAHSGHLCVPLDISL